MSNTHFPSEYGEYTRTSSTHTSTTHATNTKKAPMGGNTVRIITKGRILKSLELSIRNKKSTGAVANYLSNQLYGLCKMFN